MIENSLSISNYFLSKGNEEGITITPMKALKLVYIAHGWYLGVYGEPLIGESVQAWRYGPVVQTVYNEYKSYGSFPISELAKVGTGDCVYYDVENKDLHPFLDKIWDVYNRYTGLELSALTHKKGTPWYHIWETCNGKLEKGAIISNDLIQEHYKEKLNN